MSGFNHQPFLWPQSNDPNFSNVVFLSSMAGTPGSTTIVDESSYAENRTCLDTGFLPNRSYITAGSSKFYDSAMTVHEGSHTSFGGMVESRFQRISGTAMAVEGFVYPATRYISTATPMIVDMKDGFGNGLFNLSAYAAGANDYTFRPMGGATQAITHVAGPDGFVFVQVLVDTSDIMRLYMDGVLKYTYPAPVGTWNSVFNTIYIGGFGDGGGSYACVAYFNEWRITVGGPLRAAVVPSVPFPRY